MVDQKGRVRLPAASRRAQIMKAAADMFSGGSYDETSMEAIAKQVGIRKASLYYYFTSKDDLLRTNATRNPSSRSSTHTNGVLATANSAPAACFWQ